MSKVSRKPTKRGRKVSNDRYARSDNKYSGRESMKGEQEEVRRSIESEHKYNDISWYSHNPQMLKDSANFSFNTPLGTQLPYLRLWNTPVSGATISTPATTAVPGLLTMYYAPTIGVSNSSTSPANLAAQNIYSYVRYMNSGAKNYDQADLMLYLMAMDSIYMVWNWAKRMLGYARTYSATNRYMPRAYAKADNVNFDEIIANLADYRAAMNGLAARISSFCVPAVMPIMVRHSWMASNIYADSDQPKAQQYMFVPYYAYIYDETSSQYGGQLVFTALTGVGANGHFTNIINMLTKMLDAVGYSEDIGVMSGDILKAYGQDKLFKITPLDAEYSVEPVYNEEVLNQIHNSTVTPLGGQASIYNITQNPDSGYLVFDPVIPAPNRVSRDGVLLNMPWPTVTPENVMIATRLTTTTFNDGTNWRLNHIGSEIVISNYVVLMNSDGSFRQIQIPEYLVLSDTTGSTSDDHRTVFEQARLISNFDWHPLKAMWHVTGTQNTDENWEILGWLGDVSNYSVLGPQDLEQLHYTALMSEFNIPQLSSF